VIRDLHVVMDETALVVTGRGNALASKLIHRAHAEPGVYVYATTCALVEADRVRRGTAEHIATLPGVILLDLDLPASLAVARDTTWAPAHTRYAAAPTPDRPGGAFIATAEPDRWKGQPVRLLDLSP
jgi:hypothetical protein